MNFPHERTDRHKCNIFEISKLVLYSNWSRSPMYEKAVEGKFKASSDFQFLFDHISIF